MSKFDYEAIKELLRLNRITGEQAITASIVVAAHNELLKEQFKQSSEEHRNHKCTNNCPPDCRW